MGIAIEPRLELLSRSEESGCRPRTGPEKRHCRLKARNSRVVSNTEVSRLGSESAPPSVAESIERDYNSEKTLPVQWPGE